MLDVAIAHEKLKETARGAYGATDGGRRESFSRKLGDPLTQVRTRQVGNLATGLTGPTLKLL